MKLVNKNSNIALVLTLHQLFLYYLRQRITNQSKSCYHADVDTHISSVTRAENDFFRHKGPLVDLYGPGSVFHLIKVCDV